jgi:hypothetical protein
MLLKRHFIFLNLTDLNKLLISLLFLCAFHLSYGQDVIFDKPINFKGSKDHDAYPVINDSTGNMVMFLFDRAIVHAIFLDKDYNIMSELESARPKPESTYEEILGCGISKGVYTVFFSSSNHKSFAAVSFDFQQKKTSQLTIKFPFKKEERYIGSICHKGAFYFLTATEPDLVKVYSLVTPNEFKSRETSFPKGKFGNSAKTTLYHVLTKDDIISVDNRVPVPLDIATRRVKLYAYNNKIVLTINDYLFGTSVIDFNSKTLAGGLKFYNQAPVYCGDMELWKANAYICDNHLYQMKVCPMELAVTVTDMERDTVLNTLKLTRDGELTFANSPILVKRGYYVNEGELSKPKQLLRKVSMNDAGISAIGTPDGIELTIGGLKEISSGGGGGGGGMMMPGVPISTPYGNFTTPPAYNPTFYGYNSYKTSISFYFKSLLDNSTYQHKPGAVKDNAFDKIEKFTGPIEKKITAETIFKKEGIYVLGYYFKPDDKYILRMFTD